MQREEVLSLLLSFLVLVGVALLQRYSRLLAALTATMPLSAPLALWIVYVSNQGRPEPVQEFALGMFLGLFPTLAFLLVAYLTARAGWRLVPILLASYAVWAVGAGILWALRHRLGLP